MSLQDYLSLIPAPNSIQPNYMAWEAANLQFLVDFINVMNNIPVAFTVTTASGVQLDRLGEILRVSRTLPYNPGGGASAVLIDDFYRIALLAKIVQNQWKGTKNEIYDFWAAFVSQYPVIIQDNQDMTMNVLVIGMPNNLVGTVEFGYDTETSTIKGYDEGYWDPIVGVLRGMVTHGYFTPKPAGVSVTYSFMNNPAYAYDQNSALLQGYDMGYWAAFGS